VRRVLVATVAVSVACGGSELPVGQDYYTARVSGDDGCDRAVLFEGALVEYDWRPASVELRWPDPQAPTSYTLALPCTHADGAVSCATIDLESQYWPEPDNRLGVRFSGSGSGDHIAGVMLVLGRCFDQNAACYARNNWPTGYTCQSTLTVTLDKVDP
jgi:hypothetical protein